MVKKVKETMEFTNGKQGRKWDLLKGSREHLSHLGGPHEWKSKYKGVTYLNRRWFIYWLIGFAGLLFCHYSNSKICNNMKKWAVAVKRSFSASHIVAV